jgi:hypothetical protein
MKLEMLSLADVSESQQDVVVPADLPEEELENMKSDALENEESEARAAEETEDQVESQNLIDQVVALEALYEKIATTSEFSAHLALEAYTAAPDAYIMETFKSGAGHQAKVSIAMEGIMAKAWEAVKRFWAHLVGMWKKFMQYVGRFMSGSDRHDLKVDQQLVSALETLIHEAEQRRQHNQQQGLLLRDSIEEDSMLRSAYFQSGSGKAIPAMAKLREIVPKCGQFLQLTQKYVRDLERWAQESIKQPNAQTVMPANPESTMYDFVEAVVNLRKALPTIWFKADEKKKEKVSLNEVMNGIKATIIPAEYGIEKLAFDTAFSVTRFTEKRQKEVEAYASKDGADAGKATVYRALGRELVTLREIVSDVMFMFHNATQAQSKMLSVGSYWIWAIERAYREMATAKGYSAEDHKKFEEEHKYFQSLHDKYDKVLKKDKLHSTII